MNATCVVKMLCDKENAILIFIYHFQMFADEEGGIYQQAGKMKFVSCINKL